MSSSVRVQRIAVSSVFGVTGATFVTWAGRLPEIADSLSLGEGQVGVALLGLALGALLGLPVAGALAERWGSRRVARLGLLVFCGALVAVSVAPDLIWLTTTLAIFGAGNSAVDVGIGVQGVETERSYGRPLLGGFNALFSLGGMVGGAAGTAAAGAAIEPRLHFLGAALLLLVVGLAATGGFDATPAAEPQRLLVRPTRAVVLLGVIAFCGFFAEGVLMDWGALYLRRETGASPAWAAGGLTVLMLAMFIGRLLTDRAVQTVGPSRALHVGGLLTLVGVVLVVVVPQPVPTTAGFGLAGFGLAAVAPVIFSLAGYQPDVSPARAVAAISTIGYTAFLAGPALIGGVAELRGLRVAMATLVLFILVLMGLARGVPNRHPLLAEDD